MLRTDARRLLATFQAYLQQEIYVWLAVNRPHFAQAREWIATLTVPIQTLDALHAAMAAIQGCPILTADVVLAKACAQIGVAAHLIS
jgi:hypothetical protein